MRRLLPLTETLLTKSSLFAVRPCRLLQYWTAKGLSTFLSSNVSFEKGPHVEATPVQHIEQHLEDKFRQLMSECSLELNPAQKELLHKLCLLQNALIELSQSGVLYTRLHEANKEIRAQIDSGVVKAAPSPLNGFMTTIASGIFGKLGRKLPIEEKKAIVSVDSLVLCEVPYTAHPNLKSLYIWGGVGQGKTMMMDAFFASTPVKEKIRRHFHEFMLDVQQRLHQLHLMSMPSPNNSHFKTIRTKDVAFIQDETIAMTTIDPLLQVANQLASRYRLICLDEFQVVHIADAMILKRLFEGLLHYGCIVVATSNRPPADLYKGGLNRERFLPFIDLVESRWNIFHIVTNKDFRQQKTLLSSLIHSASTTTTTTTEDNCNNSPSSTHHFPFNCPVRSFNNCMSHVKEIAGTETIKQRGEVEVAMGRTLKVPYQSGKVCLFTFHDLCGKAVGTADYIALSTHFHTLFLYDIPNLSNLEHHSNEIRRFIQLIDILYERYIRVVFDSQAPMLKIFGTTNVIASIEELRQRIQMCFPKQLDDFISKIRQWKETDGNKVDLLMQTLSSIDKQVATVCVRVIEKTIDRVYASKQNELFLAADQRHVLFCDYFKSCIIFHAKYTDIQPNPYFVMNTQSPYPSVAFDLSSDLESVESMESSGIQDNKFAIERTMSRIRDMLTEDYLRRHLAEWAIHHKTI